MTTSYVFGDEVRFKLQILLNENDSLF